MTSLVTWVLATTALALGLAVVAFLVERLFSPRPAIRHALWLVVLVKLCIPPLVAWPWALELSAEEPLPTPRPASGAVEVFAPAPSVARGVVLAPAPSMSSPPAARALVVAPVPLLLGVWLAWQGKMCTAS